MNGLHCVTLSLHPHHPSIPRRAHPRHFFKRIIKCLAGAEAGHLGDGLKGESLEPGVTYLNRQNECTNFLNIGKKISESEFLILDAQFFAEAISGHINAFEGLSGEGGDFL